MNQGYQNLKNKIMKIISQTSLGAEPNPPLEIEFQNGSIIISQLDQIVSLNTENIDEVISAIRAALSDFEGSKMKFNKL